MIGLRKICSACLLFLAVSSSTSAAFPQSSTGPVSLTVSATPPRQSDENWAFSATFKNLGSDVNLRLGFVLRDGTEYPIYIYFILSNAKGISKELRVRTPLIAPGNMGNDVIKLGAGERHIVKLGLERLDGWQAFSGSGGTLLPGRYRLRAEFSWWENEIYSTEKKHETNYREKMNLKSDEITFTVK